MSAKSDLPKTTKKKKINLKKFVELAKKVRASFEEEEKYLEKSKRQFAPRNKPKALQHP